MRQLNAVLLGGCLLFPSDVSSQAVHRIDVGGYDVEALVAGTGSLTIIFESDIGSPLSIWSRVQPLVSDFATTVAYSRAGLGNSDVATTPRSTRQIVEELRTLLDGLGLKPPYVLVGHAFGGFLSRAYFYEYPDEVAGLVLVNDSDERTTKELQAVHPSWGTRKPLAVWDDEAILAEAALFQRVQDVGPPPNRRPLSGLPVYILTRGRPTGPGTLPMDARGLRVVRDLHADLFSGVTDGAHVIAGKSNHFIHVVEPELVAWSIRRVADSLRKSDNR